MPANGDKVSVHYTGRYADGTIFDSSIGEEPLVFTIGENEVIDGFENSIIAMAIGEKKTVTLAPEEAYGERYDDLVVEVARADMPADLELELGDELEITTEDDEPMLVIVAAMTDDTVTLDGNAPLAGEHLTFELELLSVN
jgi:peptidylprolyl isomerase